ncbi:CusA/CzcA family heavy metal efflux RND transporter [Marinilabiliaceae bacterium ANBcel2]|nr:CusA/CzcA family heavy metal efflux RND transporter [Marinilabiliaceae bacterium ANBcel2]
MKWIDKIIDSSVSKKGFAITVSATLFIIGIWAYTKLNIEAYPDPTPPLVEVIVQKSGWSAEEMERQITVPLETELNGIRGIDVIRSISLFGLSNIKVYFEWGTDYEKARQEVINRLQMADLPDDVSPELSPWSALGEIYRYELVGEGYTTMELKEAQDWIVERQFRQVPGIIDVVGFGGPTKEYHVEIDPNKLIAYNVSISDVMDAIELSNSNVGGNYLNIGEQSYNVRGVGLFSSINDIANVMVDERDGTAIYVHQLGEVKIGQKVPLGKVGKDYNSDVVTGIVNMYRGQNTLPTLEKVQEKVKEINEGGILPDGMKIVPYYDRTELVNVTVNTVQHILLAAILLVGFIMVAFLGNYKAALIVTISIPLSLLVTFLMMVIRGDSANLISMGALNLGIIVDASVIMVENIHRRLSGREVKGYANVKDTILSAAKEVAGPIFFSIAIIIVAFLPLFTMQGVEGRIFGPLAITYGFALAAALFLSLTYSPACAAFFFKGRSSRKDTFIVKWLKAGYNPIINKCVKWPKATLAISSIVLAGTLSTIPFIGGEFMPRLEEGNLWVRATMPNSISFTKSEKLVDEMRELILDNHPEVTTVVSQLGQDDEGTEAIGWFNVDMFVDLKPMNEWRDGLNKEELISEIETTLSQISGVAFSFSQNIQDNVEEAMAGVRGENVVKLFGEDLETLEIKAAEIEETMKGVEGIADLAIYTKLGQPNMLVEIDRERAARYGVLTKDVNKIVQAAVGGEAVTQRLDGDRRFDVVVRTLPEFRTTKEEIKNIPVSTGAGYIPLKEVAKVYTQSGASFIYREGNARYIPIAFSVRGRDLQGTVNEAEASILEQVDLPTGYRMEWAGEFQQLQDAIDRLIVVIPLSIILIVFLLYIHFRNLRDCLLVLASVPFAMIGGVLILIITGTDFSISATVGFICVLGEVVLNGVILVSFINKLRKDGKSLIDAVTEGSKLRLRAVMMIAMAAGIGLFPAAISTGIGSETQQPLAQVVVASMMTAPAATLLVLPTLYLLVYKRK